MDDPAAVDAYLAGLPEPQQGMLRRVRALAREACPEATEGIYYRMPGFRLRGKLLLSYAGHTGHCALYPASTMVREALGADLAPHLTEKATIRFGLDQPLPEALVRRIVEVRVAEGTGPRGGG